MDTKFPDIVVPITGHNGYAGSVVGRVVHALKEHGVSNEEIAEFRKDALSDDHDHLLRTTMAWVNVE